MNVVFTGPAYDNSGKSIVRADLVAACKAKKIVVQGAIKPDTAILVASRADTLKAKTALGHGVTVMTYPAFIGEFLSGAAIEAGGSPNSCVDVAVQAQVPDFTTVGYGRADAMG